MLDIWKITTKIGYNYDLNEEINRLIGLKLSSSHCGSSFFSSTSNDQIHNVVSYQIKNIEEREKVDHMKKFCIHSNLHLNRHLVEKSST
jgi:ribosomal protein L33